MFKVKCSDIPDFIMGTENNSLAELAMPGAASGVSYEGIGAQNFLGPAGAEYQPFLALSDTDNYPWLVPIPHYSAKINDKDYKLVYRSCCDYINPTSSGTTFTPTSSTKDWFNDGNNYWYDEGGQSLFNEPTSHIMIAMQAGGGGGSGSGGMILNDGRGGGGGAAAILIINIGKLSAIRFNPGAGGAAGAGSADLNTHRHGGDGGNSSIVMSLSDGSTMTVYVEGGKGAKGYSTNSGGGNEAGAGGKGIVHIQHSGSTTALEISTDNLSNINYIGVTLSNNKLSYTYSDDNHDAVFYVLKVYGGGDGGTGSAAADMITGPVVTTQQQVSFYPGINYTIVPRLARDHTYYSYEVAGLNGTDGGFSLYGSGGICSIAYISGILTLWTDAQPPIGYGAGGSGDVFLVGFGKNGTAGGDGFIQILSANGTGDANRDKFTTPMRQSGILSPGAVVGKYITKDDMVNESAANYSIDDFVACSYEGDNTGVITPTIYTKGSNSEYPIDWEGPYFYQGTKTLFSTTYDSWRRIDAGYPWNGDSQKIVYTNRVITNNRFNKDLCNQVGVHTVSSSGAKTVNPTCVSEGYTYSNCAECGYRFKGNITPALGHVEGDWLTITEATVNSFGTRQKKCTRCHKVIAIETIPMLDPEVDTYDTLRENAVTWMYYIMDDQTHEGMYSNKEFIAGGYAKDNTDTIVPVLYAATDENPTEPSLNYRYYYVGPAELDGETYDKWIKVRKIEGNFKWEEIDSACAVYTNVVIQNNRFKNNIFANKLSGTVQIDWSVIGQILYGQSTTYRFSSMTKTINAPEGYTITEITKLQRGPNKLTSGEAPFGIAPTATIANDGKSFTIQLTAGDLLSATGEGTMTVTYECSCAPIVIENEKVETGTAGVPYTTTTSAQNGNQYPITSQSSAAVTAPEGYIIQTIELGSIYSANDSHGVSNVTASAAISSDKKTATISLSGYVQGVGSGSNSSYMYVPYTATYVLE